jgi:hypothetical protein
MAKLCLNHVHRDTLSGQFRRVGVPQPVRVYALLDASLCCEALESVPNVRGIDRVAVEGAEDRGAALDPESLPLFQPTLDEGKCTGVETHRARAVALAVQDAHRAVLAVHVLGLERQCL